MTLIEIEDTSMDGPLLKIVVCPLCGDEHGEDFERFSWHVYSEHGPEDAGLSPLGERTAV